MLLDEPTAGLDPESAHDTRALIRRLRSENRTVILSTHNLDEVDRIADRVGVLRTACGSGDESTGLNDPVERAPIDYEIAGRIRITRFRQ